MKFTIQATTSCVCLQQDGTPALCRMFQGTAENGAQVRFVVAHYSVSNQSEGYELVQEFFRRLDADAVAKASRGEILIQENIVEEPTPPRAKEIGQA